MKEIIYKGKKVKVPFEDANYTLDGEKDVVLKNRFGGEECTVPGYAAAVYDVIIGAEQFKDYVLVTIQSIVCILKWDFYFFTFIVYSFMFVSYIIPELLSSLLLACCWFFFIFSGQVKQSVGFPRSPCILDPGSAITDQS